MKTQTVLKQKKKFQITSDERDRKENKEKKLDEKCEEKNVVLSLFLTNTSEYRGVQEVPEWKMGHRGIGGS
jgi:hypothetical protein